MSTTPDRLEAPARHGGTRSRAAPAPGRPASPCCSTASTSATCGSARPSSCAASTRPFATSTGTRCRPRSPGSASRSGDSGFRVEFDARHARGEIDFEWHGTISGTRAVASSTCFDGRARGVCPYNRIGICVHHPWRETSGRDLPRAHARGRDRRPLPGPHRSAAVRRRVPRALRRVRPARGRPRRRRVAAPRVRGRPLGDGGSPQLDGRQLQDVLHSDRARAACAPRARAGAPAAARDHAARRPERRCGGGRPGAALARRADGNAVFRPSGSARTVTSTARTRTSGTCSRRCRRRTCGSRHASTGRSGAKRSPRAARRRARSARTSSCRCISWKSTKTTSPPSRRCSQAVLRSTACSS